MKLPWPSRDAVKPPSSDEASSEVARPPVATYTSPGLEAAFAGLPEPPACRVLELGPAVGDNVAFVSRLAQLIEVVDMGRVPFGRRSPVGPAIERDISRLRELQAEGAGPFDLVLAWDLLNYVSRESLSEFVELLAILCAPRGRLLATVFEGETMPARPSRYRIAGPTRLVSEAVTRDVTGAPDLPPAEIERLFRGFRVERSFVLRHGAREYLAVASSSGSSLRT
jgi:hypothetical protein